MEDTFNFDAPVMSNFDASAEEESFGETENFFSRPLYRHERSRRKSAGIARAAIREQANENRRKSKRVVFVEPVSTEGERESGTVEQPEKVEQRAAKRRKITIPQGPSMLERKKANKTTGERSEIQAAVARRKRKVAKPSALKPTVPKGPSMLERPKKTMPKPNAQKETDATSSKIPDHLSEFRKYKPSNSRPKNTVVQPFNFMKREEERKRAKEEREAANQDHREDDEITFRAPKQLRRKTTSAVIDRLAQPRAPVVRTEPNKRPDRPKTDLRKVLAAPPPLKKCKKEPTKAVTPKFQLVARASHRKTLQEANQLKEKERHAKELEREVAKEKKDRQEIKALRASQVHTAQGIRAFKPMGERESLPTTTPLTPKLATSSRQRNKEN